MKSDNLVTMANQIGAFFETMPDRQQAMLDIAGHLKRFWEPNMRRCLFQYIDEHVDADADKSVNQQGHKEIGESRHEGLKAIVLEALQRHRASVI